MAGGKRVLDIALVICAAPFALPVVAVLWAAVRLQDGGSGFYSHPRVGHGGRPFRCYKLRSMTPEGGQPLRQMLETDPELRAEWRARQKLTADPRITPLGSWLRRTGFDELPQLWNVLCGEMSLVGPRPITAEELRYYGVASARYLAVRPGLTGLWQITGRKSRGDWHARRQLDLNYLSHMSLSRDFLILVRTVSAVLRAEGE